MLLVLLFHLLLLTLSLNMAGIAWTWSAWKAMSPNGFSGVEESDESDDDGARAMPRTVPEDFDPESEGEEEEKSEDEYSDAT